MRTLEANTSREIGSLGLDIIQYSVASLVHVAAAYPELSVHYESLLAQQVDEVVCVIAIGQSGHLKCQ